MKTKATVIGLQKYGPQTLDKLLLKDYRPRSIYKIPQTQVPKARYPIIDVHSHPYANTEEEISRWVRTMDDPRLDDQPGILYNGKLLETLDRTAEKHPRTISITCHFANCCADLEKIGAMLDAHPNL